MRPPASSLALHAFAASLLVLSSTGPARAQTPPDVAVEIARLRGRLADTGAQQHECLARATQPVWTAAVATDIKALQDRANQAASDGTTAETRRWKELAKKAELLQAQLAERGRNGADLFQSQQTGLDCLDRHAEEREAMRGAPEIPVRDPCRQSGGLRPIPATGALGRENDLARGSGRPARKGPRPHPSVEAGPIRVGGGGRDAPSRPRGAEATTHRDARECGGPHTGRPSPARCGGVDGRSDGVGVGARGRDANQRGAERPRA